ncbi:peptide chain release factor 2 [candidate division WOR-1 bacterium RIFCSPLOWO2_02_FULL_46_20]|uniref:Peptide chain release factor 2 n=1 Tax=candidate division WOR-1 bacterium RIFCSPLOWO2_02_FULL_46_20 TaxID=1802567 RepID=A0A1F4RF23_UNCSA|nr:MAG: peptide chain release factor 2 [candidate division WOR-1 bacterium RIFCSPLOWO2_02_FULL_46_20]
MLDDLKNETGQLQDKAKDLGKLLNIINKKKTLGKLEQEASDPKLWENQNKARKLLQDKKVLEKEISTWETLLSGAEDLKTLINLAKESDAADLSKELAELKNKATELELAVLLGGEYDKNNAILSINAGAGGTDAQDWAQILFRMYSRWAESKDFKIDLPDISYGEEAGIKGVTIIISGPYAYGYLKSESGIHRLVRISPFSSEGKRHTSFVAVEVIPEIAEEVSVEIDPKDLKIDTYRASGPGGQNVNKVSSAVRITHIPTGIVTQSQADRSQHNNRESAMKILKARLYEMMAEQHKEKIDELRGQKKKIEWGSQIRSYIFHPYTLVKDHRTNTEVGNVQKVIDGDLDLFMEASLRRGTK